MTIILSAWLCLLLYLENASSFAFVHSKGRQRLLSFSGLTMSSNSAVAERTFHEIQQQQQRQQIPSTSGVAAGFKSDRIVHCANELGLCDIDEMMDMMQELDRLNLECTGVSKRQECSVEAFDARKTLKVALATNVAVEEAMEECDVDFHSDDPYWEMNLMHDECLNSKMIMHQIPTATLSSSHEDGLEHIVDCAENGQCEVQEMMQMIEELEHLNMECETGMSRQCTLDAVEARNVLKVSLASRMSCMM